MNATGIIVRTPDEQSILGLGESVHSARQRFAAIAVCIVLVAVALLAIRFGSVQGPEVKAFLPIVTTMWALADLMTAFLLLAQFYVNGTTFFTVLAAAYALSGLLTWPYLYAFPGIFNTGRLPLAEQQISIWIWALWHAVFPVIVSTSVLLDPELKQRTLSRTSTRNAVLITIGGTVCVAAALTALVFVERSMLPVVIRNGHYSVGFSRRIAPVIAALNIFGCALLLRRRADMTTLQLWLFVAMFTAMLDAVLLSNAPTRYSYGWYIGKTETVMTASVVLAILLCEVTGLYRRLAEMATIDTLTRLPNRRALEDHMRLVLNHAKRQASGLGLLVVDVDLFKGYNDSYGHAQGDECLRRVAAVLKIAATRPLDLATRFGGEEFVIVVPETPRAGAIAVAERLLTLMEKAAIPYAGYPLGHVTISAGIGYAANARCVDATKLFDLADGALYEAKSRGRNTFVVADYGIVPPKVVPLRPSDTSQLVGT